MRLHPPPLGPLISSCWDDAFEIVSCDRSNELGVFEIVTCDKSNELGVFDIVTVDRSSAEPFVISIHLDLLCRIVAVFFAFCCPMFVVAFTSAHLLRQSLFVSVHSDSLYKVSIYLLCSWLRDIRFCFQLCWFVAPSFLSFHLFEFVVQC